MKRIVSGIMLTMLLTGMLTLALNIPNSALMGQPEQWVPYVPQASYVEFYYWKKNGTSYMNVSIEFASSGFNVSDWGTPDPVGNNISVNAKIWRWTGVDFPVVITMSYTYNLGNLLAGEYIFTFKAWGFSIKSMTFTVSIIVPDDYPTIQEAIDNAASGDTIFVRAGTYSEHIEINKSLTLEGESNQNTIIKGKMEAASFGIHITASNVTLKGFRISYDVAPVILIFLDSRNGTCFNNTIKGNVLISITTNTLDICSSSGNSILDNTIYCDEESSGIALIRSSFNIVKNNTVVGGFMSIFNDWGGNNLILDNFMTHQVVWEDITGAITFQFVSNNTVVGNTFVENERAIDIFRSSNNTIHHNNFINNTVQVVSTPEYKNFWDGGYPSGGNYWSDYIGTDLFNGPCQNLTGSDGIGDTPYVIDADNRDRYPLMKPWTHLIGDVNGDGKVDIKDLVLFIKAFGSYPTHPRWNPSADVNSDNKIDIRDLVLLLKYFGEHS